MPSKKRYARRGTVVRKRRSSGRRGGNVVGQQNNFRKSFALSLFTPTAIPMQRKCIVKYAEVFDLSTGTAIFGAEQRMRLNSIYDPNYQGTGHSVRNYSLMSGQYQRYRVDSVRFSITFCTPGTTVDLLCGATTSASTAGSIANQAIFFADEADNGQTGILPSSGERKVILGGRINLPALLGVTKAQYEAEENFASSMGASPVATPLVSFAICAMNGANGLTAVARVVLEYSVTFMNAIR